MAFSSSTDFTLTAVDLVTQARAKLGISADEEPLAAHEVVNGIVLLNMMLKSWQAMGVSHTLLTEGTLTLVASTASYLFGTGGAFTTLPLEITDARINRGGNDLPMTQMSREEYYDLPNKTTTGYPTCWFYDRQRSSGTFYVWPTPDASAGTLKFTYRRVVMDMDANTNNLDLPQEWYEAVVYNLADRIAETMGLLKTASGQRVAMKAAASLAVLVGFDTATGKGSLSIMPDC